MDAVEVAERRLENASLAPLVGATRSYWLVVIGLGLVVAWGVFAYTVQIRDGLIATGMRDRILWGLYISNFVFFIGISHAGTLISAILRVAQAGWRTPITRMAEFITVVALSMGAIMPLIDMGRPDRLLNMFLFGRWQSPLIWDVIAITTYLTASIIYLYLPLIPDLALCRDRLTGRVASWRAWFFRVAAVNWQGTPSQWRYLRIAMALMMILIIPIAVSVHTVVSWIFGMTLRESWDTAVFGIFFVSGAIFSGVASILILMAILRKVYHLEEYITLKHFRYLGYIMGTFCAIMVYFNISEYVTAGYKLSGEGSFLFRQLFAQQFAPWYWFYIIGGISIPAFLVFSPWTKSILGIVAAAILVDMGMWVERFFIVVSGLRVPLMPYTPAEYAPTWVEISITLGAFAAFCLVIMVFAKLFPLLAVWEVAEGLPEKAPEGDASPAGEPRAAPILEAPA